MNKPLHIMVYYSGIDRLILKAYFFETLYIMGFIHTIECNQIHKTTPFFYPAENVNIALK